MQVCMELPRPDEQLKIRWFCDGFSHSGYISGSETIYNMGHPVIDITDG